MDEYRGWSWILQNCPPNQSLTEFLNHLGYTSVIELDPNLERDKIAAGAKGTFLFYFNKATGRLRQRGWWRESLNESQLALLGMIRRDQFMNRYCSLGEIGQLELVKSLALLVTLLETKLDE